MNHWFDGFGMLHKFSITNGQITYTNRFIQSYAYTESMRRNQIATRGFATDPQTSLIGLWSKKITDDTNVNVTKQQEYLALTETNHWNSFSVDDLSTRKHMYHDKIKGMIASAHPLFDPTSKEWVSHMTQVIPGNSSYNFFSIKAGSRNRESLARISTRRPAYIHSFGLTKNYIILVEFPLVLNQLKLAFSGKPFIENFEWKPKLGTKFHLIERSSGRRVKTYRAGSFFCFHHVNAFEESGEICVDLISFEDSSLVQLFYLDQINNLSTEFPESKLMRFRLRLDQEELTSEVLFENAGDFPRINPKFTTRENRFIYTASSAQVRSPNFLDQLTKLDTKTRRREVWAQAGCYPGEPVFVIRPDSCNEDDGVILSLVLDTRKQASFLLILGANNLKELSRAYLPHMVPFGLHGEFYFR